LLQKSIRRGETEIAQRAALTFFKLKGSAIWRRLMVIAFEDVGIGSVDALMMTVAASSDTAWRRTCGTADRVAVHLASVLAEAPKDRSADFLVGAKDHPALATFARTMATASLEDRLSAVSNKLLALPHRAIAARFTSGLESRGQVSRDKDSLDVLLKTFRELGAPEDLVVATGLAATRTREPITAMVPLIWLAAKVSREVRVCDCPVPPMESAGNVPLYALDEHTRLGREAIWRFACENNRVRTGLESFVPASQRRRAANVAAFYADAAPVARRLLWEQSSRLETFGIDRDLLHAGVVPEGIAPLLEAVRSNLDHLNALRAQVLSRSRAVQATGPARRKAVP
jgi:hypothetical protein